MNYSSRMIARAWAHQDSEDGKCPSAMTFEGGKFYSYSTVIAERVERDDKVVVFFVSLDTYSPTTSRHLSKVRSALHCRANVFYVPGVRRGHSDLSDLDRIFGIWQNTANGKLAEAGKAQREIKRSRRIVEAYEVVVRMRKLAEFFHESLDTYAVKIPMPEKSLVDAATFAGIGALKHLEPSPWMYRSKPTIDALLGLVNPTANPAA
jgi:hypothetical protein